LLLLFAVVIIIIIIIIIIVPYVVPASVTVMVNIHKAETETELVIVLPPMPTVLRYHPHVCYYIVLVITPLLLSTKIHSFLLFLYVCFVAFYHLPKLLLLLGLLLLLYNSLP
jgi:hypothetical protein